MGECGAAVGGAQEPGGIPRELSGVCLSGPLLSIPRPLWSLKGGSEPTVDNDEAPWQDVDEVLPGYQQEERSPHPNTASGNGRGRGSRARPGSSRGPCTHPTCGAVEMARPEP